MHATITAHLDTPVIGTIGPLDGPLAWAAWQLAEARGDDLAPITDTHVPDFPLPLHRWERAGYWGWRVSNPITTPVHHSSVEIRRKPATGPMAIYTQAREHHVGLGPMKARNVTLAATHHPTVVWHAHVTDVDALHEHLEHITHLGARHRNGHGHVTHWDVVDGPVDGWQDRPLPHPQGTLQRVRAPYWHPTERTPCR